MCTEVLSDMNVSAALDPSGDCFRPWRGGYDGYTTSMRRCVVTTDQLGLFEQASEWTLGKIAGATARLDAETPCDGWVVRDLLSHMLETQQYFVSSALGHEASPPSPVPTTAVGDDPVTDFRRARADTMRTFGEPGVIDKTGMSLGIAFSDQLLHGWDLARATGQDEMMPAGLPEAAYEIIHGQFTDEQRKGIFKPEVTVMANASAQERLLAYTGRKS
jgi:uncharacterized protein (TIGR03086 family)